MRIDDSILEKIYGKKICTQAIKFEGDIFEDNVERTIEFDVYDGFAYCGDFEGSEYYMAYPKIEFINSVKDMQNAVKDFMGLKDTEPITATDILQSYSDLHKIDADGSETIIISFDDGDVEDEASVETVPSNASTFEII